MSPDGCRGQRSTLPWQPHLRDLRHAGGGPAESGPEIALIGLGRGQQPDQDAFHRFNLRPCGQSRLTRAHCYVCPRSTPHPYSPTANRPSSSRNRPPHEATSPPLRPPFSAPHDHGEDAFTRFLQPTYDTSTLSDRSILESPPPAAFARGTASAASGPAETVSETRSSGARLTTSFQLRLRRELASRSPEQPAPFGPVGPDQGPSETTLPIFPAAFSTARRGRDPASDVLCRDPPCTGRESRFGGPPGPLPPPPRSKDDGFTGPGRLPLAIARQRLQPNVRP
jgi:hypothetical protein